MVLLEPEAVAVRVVVNVPSESRMIWLELAVMERAPVMVARAVVIVRTFTSELSARDRVDAPNKYPGKIFILVPTLLKFMNLVLSPNAVWTVSVDVKTNSPAAPE